MLMRVLAASLLVAGLLSGCAGLDSSTKAATAVGGLHAGSPLWNDPQNAPHPKWNWPTLSSPPANATGWWTPIVARALPNPVSGLEHVAQAMNGSSPISQGAGIAVFGHVAVVPEDREYAHFIDISDPTHPVEVGRIESSGRGAAVIAYPDGRLVTAISTSPGFDVIDFTDPTQPEMLAQVAPREGGHKLGVVPGTPILYNAGSSGGEPLPNPVYGPGLCNVSIDQCVGYTSIYNLTDPANPVLVQEFHNGLACHHIFFWNNAAEGRFRALCAGIQYTQIWDTADPEHPKVLVSIPVHTGVADTPSQMVSIAAFSHSAGLNTDGTILYVGDENMGGGYPPGCVLGTSTPAGEAGTPVGATWFYDVRDELHPRLLGYFAPPRDAGHQVARSCTTHHGRIVPAEGRDLLAMSYYNDGVILVDFTPTMGEGGPAIVPKVVDEFNDGSDTWETWYDQGYLFTGDLARGMDVLTFK
jgi:hypothetical protein